MAIKTIPAMTTEGKNICAYERLQLFCGFSFKTITMMLNLLLFFLQEYSKLYSANYIFYFHYSSSFILFDSFVS